MNRRGTAKQDQARRLPRRAAALQVGVFAFKLWFIMFLFVWIRWTLPRFRYDQLMSLGWRVMLPLALVNIFVTSIVPFVLGVY